MSLKHPNWSKNCAWSVKSKKDKRFNLNGNGTWGYFIGCGKVPDEIESKIKKIEKKHGVKRPDDLEFSAFLDDESDDSCKKDDDDIPRMGVHYD